MFGRSLLRQAVDVKSWSHLSLSGPGVALGEARSPAQPSQVSSYSSSASSRRSLVQDLKYRFRIKAAQKHEQQGRGLSRVTVTDVRNIWMYRLMSEVGLPSYNVEISNEIVLSMEEVVKNKIPQDEDGFIQFEEFLPHLVFLMRVKVTPQDEEEMVIELMQHYLQCNLFDIDESAREELRSKSLKIIQSVRDKVVTHQ